MKREVVFYRAKYEMFSTGVFLVKYVVKGIHLEELNIMPFPSFCHVPQNQTELSNLVARNWHHCGYN